MRAELAASYGLARLPDRTANSPRPKYAPPIAKRAGDPLARTRRGAAREATSAYTVSVPAAITTNSAPTCARHSGRFSRRTSARNRGWSRSGSVTDTARMYGTLRSRAS